MNTVRILLAAVALVVTGIVIGRNRPAFTLPNEDDCGCEDD